MHFTFTLELASIRRQLIEWTTTKQYNDQLTYIKAAVRNIFVLKIYKINIISEYIMNPFSKPCFLAKKLRTAALNKELLIYYQNE